MIMMIISQCVDSPPYSESFFSEYFLLPGNMSLLSPYRNLEKSRPLFDQFPIHSSSPNSLNINFISNLSLLLTEIIFYLHSNLDFIGCTIPQLIMHISEVVLQNFNKSHVSALISLDFSKVFDITN